MGNTTIEQCANCGAAIGTLETPCVWGEHVVCATCHAKLAGQQTAGGAASSPSPIPRWTPPARQKPQAFKDYLRVPRFLILLIAIAVSLLPLLNDTPIRDADHSLAYLLWGSWFALGLVAIVQKASWKARRDGH